MVQLAIASDQQTKVSTRRNGQQCIKKVAHSLLVLQDVMLIRHVLHLIIMKEQWVDTVTNTKQMKILLRAMLEMEKQNGHVTTRL